jgi:hypothetical protein
VILPQFVFSDDNNIIAKRLSMTGVQPDISPGLRLDALHHLDETPAVTGLFFASTSR